MKLTYLENPSTSKGEFQEPPLSPKPNYSSGYQLDPWLIATVWHYPSQGTMMKILANTC
jgi:hypothetical protein